MRGSHLPHFQGSESGLDRLSAFVIQVMSKMAITVFHDMLRLLYATLILIVFILLSESFLSTYKYETTCFTLYNLKLQ